MTSGSTITESYGYGALDNRLATITKTGQPTRSFSYDAAGNTTYDSASGATYAYNAANRLESLTVGAVLKAEYLYNAQGQQVSRKLYGPAQTLHSVHDLAGNRIAEYDYDPSIQTATLIREYIWMDGRAVGVIEGGTLYYVRTDWIGRPAFATNSSGTKVWEAQYLPFGGVHTSTGTPLELRFPGQWFQSESGLHQNWMRDYDPTTGRYIQADPLGLVDGASVYNYAMQNPGKRSDFFGLLTIFIGGAGDQFTNIVSRYMGDYNRDPNKVYFTWNKLGQIVAAIEAEANSSCPEKITVIGHSWGADTAAHAAQITGDVDTLVTVDGVPRIFSLKVWPPGLAKDIWINIFAVGNDGTTSGDKWANTRMNRKNRESRFGNADINIPMPYHHDDFGPMMDLLLETY